MESLQILSRSEMRNVNGGRIEEDCVVVPITFTFNGDCNGRLKCGDEYHDIPCCSDFGQTVGWCRA